jgi:hypothetical protein
MHELIRQVSGDAGVTPETAEQAVKIVLRFLDRDGPSDKVRDLAAQLGLSDLLDGGESRRGLLGGISGMMGGGAMAAFAELSSAGLDMSEIQTLTSSFVGYAREKAGPEIVDEIVASIPGLEQFI